MTPAPTSQVFGTSAIDEQVQQLSQQGRARLGAAGAHRLNPFARRHQPSRYQLVHRQADGLEHLGPLLDEEVVGIGNEILALVAHADVVEHRRADAGVTHRQIRALGVGLYGDHQIRQHRPALLFAHDLRLEHHDGEAANAYDNGDDADDAIGGEA